MDFTNVQIDNTPSLSLIHEVSHPVTEGNQAGPALHKHMLTGVCHVCTA